MIQLQLTAVIASVSIFLAIVAIFLRNALLVASGLYVRVNPTGSERVFTPSPATDKLASHIYADDGLLHVNPNGQHPIIELMGRAQKEWQTKLDRASKTLPAAVAEYQRRYKRLPPPGFDAWWNYVEEHNVMLPDEYDQIWRDLEPFWAMEPLDLQRLVEDEQAEVETYTIGRDNMTSPVALNIGRRKMLCVGGRHRRTAEGCPTALTAISSDARTRGQLFAAAAKNQSQSIPAIGRQTLIFVAVPLSGLPKAETKNLQLTCRPTSPAYKYGIDFTKPPPALPKGKTFIWNHRTSMDPCIHPSLFYQHGEFLGLDDRTYRLKG
ncbi:glycosyltransferase family protein [Salix suchowensis]|nr:glycosyltransferase family protein [Salix suchowensis]